MQFMSILRFRYCVFGVALGYRLYQFSTDNYDTFGWQFRHLTFWGLTGAVCAAWLMLSLSRKGRPPAHNALSSSVAVLNAMVVFLYWKLYFVDPSLVNGNGPIVWHQEYYLHLVGPLLMIGDAVFINRAFKDHLAGVSLTIGICLTYILWVETIVRPLNIKPIGSVTSGLPYPFLNDMVFTQRAVFYATTIATALIIYGAFWLFKTLFYKLTSRKLLFQRAAFSRSKPRKSQ